MLGPSRQNVLLALDAGTFEKWVETMTPEDRRWCENYAMELEVMHDCLEEWYDLTDQQAWEKVKEAVL